MRGITDSVVVVSAGKLPYSPERDQLLLLFNENVILPGFRLPSPIPHHHAPVPSKLTRLRIVVVLYVRNPYGLSMPEIEVSDSLYQQIVDAAGEDELDRTMWQMVYEFKRCNDPAE